MSIVIAAVPYVDTTEMLMAPGYLKAIAAQHGFDSVALDLNIEVLNLIEHNPNKDIILNFFLTQEIHNDIVDDLTSIVNYCANRIQFYKPKIIALSLLTFLGQIATRWICAKLRQICPDAKIVIGGPGIKNFAADSNYDFYNSIKQLQLVDDIIHGDGELSFPEYLKGNRDYPGINNLSWNRVDLSQIPIPDYSDYDFSLYKNPDIPIIDSKGCVKNCEFCDIIEFWDKYQYRTADSIFSEMLYQIEKYKIYNFQFRSSLVNGNMKEFKKLIALISEYNDKNDIPITWGGYFIIRSMNNHNLEFMELLGKSKGCIWVGIESVIAEVRKNMGKPYSNNDLDYHLECSQKYGYTIALLLIVAYPHETLEDYEYTKQWFRDRTKFIKNIKYVNLSIASILPGTELARKSMQYNIKQGPYPSVWINQNLKISTKQRLDYFQELHSLVKNLGYPVLDNQESASLVMHTDEY